MKIGRQVLAYSSPDVVPLSRDVFLLGVEADAGTSADRQRALCVHGVEDSYDQVERGNLLVLVHGKQ